ncbi:MAG: DNA cytosine methyltransferase [Planctomycetota bacterium]
MNDRGVMRIVEWFSGIGGVAEAIRQASLPMRTVAAIDIDQEAAETYEFNFGLKPEIRTIESLSSDRIWEWADAADCWWLSPPCQPYCIRSQSTRASQPQIATRSSEQDARGKALRRLIRFLEDDIGDVPNHRLPRYIILENVPLFLDSPDSNRLMSALSAIGYNVTRHLICPSQLGIPNRRLRAYVIASKGAMPMAWNQAEFESDAHRCGPLLNYLNDHVDGSFRVANERVARFRGAMSIVDRSDPKTITACFTSAYGRSAIRSGSYLREIGGDLRLFTPPEVARLLGFGEDFCFPGKIGCRRRWKLLGNSLSIWVVREVLAGVVQDFRNVLTDLDCERDASSVRSETGVVR